MIYPIRRGTDVEHLVTCSEFWNRGAPDVRQLSDDRRHLNCMYACMFVCVYIYIYTHIYLYIHTCIHVYMYTYVHIHTYIYIYKCNTDDSCQTTGSRQTRYSVCVYIYIYMIYIYIYMFTHTTHYIYIYMDGVRLGSSSKLPQSCQRSQRDPQLTLI